MWLSVSYVSICLEVLIQIQSVLLKYYIILWCTNTYCKVNNVNFFTFECIINVLKLMPPDTDIKIHIDQLVCHCEEMGKKLPTALNTEMVLMEL